MAPGSRIGPTAAASALPALNAFAETYTQLRPSGGYEMRSMIRRDWWTVGKFTLVGLFIASRVRVGESPSAP